MESLFGVIFGVIFGSHRNHFDCSLAIAGSSHCSCIVSQRAGARLACTGHWQDAHAMPCRTQPGMECLVWKWPQLDTRVRHFPLAAMPKLARSMLLVCRACYRHASPVEDDVQQGTGGHHAKLCSVLEWLVGKWPELNSASRAADLWASGPAEAIRCARGIAGSWCSNPIFWRAAPTKKELTKLLALYSQSLEKCLSTQRTTAVEEQ